MISATPTPFLKWAGGKRQLLPALSAALPSDIGARRYVDPFLGGGSLFFALCPKQALLSDANEDLIATYRQVRDATEATVYQLSELIRCHSYEFYYQIRASYNEKAGCPPLQAARFIYLNMSCFNGIFRVNTQGKFNVPKGSKERLRFPDSAQYDANAGVLGSAQLSSTDYQNVLSSVRSDDFVYLDPPYPPLTSTAYFTHYTQSRFGTDEQQNVAAFARAVDKAGAAVLISNADTPYIRELYSGFRLVSVPAKRYINCKGIRTPVSELILTNY